MIIEDLMTPSCLLFRLTVDPWPASHHLWPQPSLHPPSLEYHEVSPGQCSVLSECSSVYFPIINILKNVNMKLLSFMKTWRRVWLLSYVTPSPYCYWGQQCFPSDTRSFICKPFSCFLTRDYDVFNSAQPDLLHMT